MNFWSEIVGQPEAVATLERAAAPGADGELSHAWLITGPPGSGRSNIAQRFAAALIARDPAEREHVYAQVRAQTHPDATLVTTQKLIIGIDDVRDVVASSHYAPADGRHRVIVVEDADRMAERTSNVLLKSLEEPPERTIWVLCAPSEADLLPTIRSRARSLRLVTPPIAEIARLLHERDGVEPRLAERAARLAQSHIGMARRLAESPDAMQRRERTIELGLSVVTLGDAMRAAAELAKVAEADAAALSSELDEQERESALRSMGLASGATVPPQLRAQLRALEEDQKRRQKRSVNDGLDRVFTDLLSLYRDVLLTAMHAGVELVNVEHGERIEAIAEAWDIERALDAVSAVELARERLRRAVTPGLVVEAMLARIAVNGETRMTR